MATGYVAASLGQGEDIVYRARVSKAIYSPGCLLLAVAGVVSFWIPLVGLGLLVVAAINLLWAAIYSASTEVAVTPRRVIAKWGVINQLSIEQRLARLDSVSVRNAQSGGFAEILIRGSGSTLQPIKWISDPMELKRQIDAAVEAVPAS